MNAGVVWCLSLLAVVFAFLAITSRPVFWLMVIVCALAALTDCAPPERRRPLSRPRRTTPPPVPE